MITKQDLINTVPCEEYTKEYIDTLFGDLTSGSYQDILAAQVHITDKIWILLREPFLNKEQLTRLATMFYKDVEDLGTLRAQYYRYMTLLASKRDLTGEHFKKLEPDYADKWREATSIESQAAILTGIWAALTVNAQCKALDIPKKERLDVLFSHRTSQLNQIISIIEEM